MLGNGANESDAIARIVGDGAVIIEAYSQWAIVKVISQRSITDPLAIARQHYAHQRFDRAEAIARQLVGQLDDLDTNGSYDSQTDESFLRLVIDVYMLLGMTLQQQRKFAEAEDCYEHLIQIAPTHSPAYNNLALVLKAQGDVEMAIHWLEQAIAISPTSSAAYNNLGNILRHQGQLSQAQFAYEQALQYSPDNLDTKLNLGLVRRAQGDLKGAIALYQDIIRTDPTFVDAYNELGNLLQSGKAFEEAVRCYNAGLRHAPTSTALLNNLGAALQELGRHDEAIASYHRVLQLQPTYADAYYNLGNALRSLDRLDDAIVAYRKARVLIPDDAKVTNNLGLALHDQGKIREAIACYHHSIHVDPKYPDAHLNLGISLLKNGDLVEGLRAYEWRWKVKGRDFKPPRPFSQPLWHGQNLPKQTLLIYAEQGLGDTLQFIRFVPYIANRIHRIIVECQPPLKALLEAMPEIDQVICSGDPIPEFDLHAPLMSLPYILGISLANVPATVPYLTPPSESCRGKPLVAPADGLKVGIVWAGSPTHQNNRHRSCPFQSFERVLGVPSISVYSLQKGAGEADLEGKKRTNLINLAPQLTHMADTAAAIAQLDLVITVDTSVAHLAGALGTPVWILLGFAYDWRWLCDRPDSPWYPTARLFHQPSPGDWKGLFDGVIRTLQRCIASDEPLTLQPMKSPAHRAIVSEPSTVKIDISPERLTQLQLSLKQGKIEDAIAQCTDILNDAPDQPQALEVMGRIAYQQQRYSQAIAHFEHLCRVHGGSADIWSQLGNAYLHNGNHKAALKWYETYLEVHPTASATRNNLGVALRALGRDAEAIAHYQLILQQDPESVDTYFNLANAYREQERLEDAISAYQEVVTRQPGYAHAWNNLANALKDLNRVDEAIAAYRRAIALMPNHASAHHNLGYALLLKGDFRTGWAEYEWRWRVKNFQSPPPHTQPPWDGAPLDGKTLLLYTEQGFGDAIQFIRFVPLVAQRGGRIMVQCRPPLARLFRSIPDIDAIVLRHEPLPDFDVHAPLMSLPYLLGITLDTLPSPLSYVSAPNEDGNGGSHDKAMDDRAIALSPSSPIKIGIAWAGSPTHQNDHNRSCPFAYFWSLLRTPNTQFFSLQKGSRHTDIANYCNEDWPLIDLSDRLTDFAETARAIAQLDLVITVDTSVAHLAAALGKPTWIVLSYAPDWRWMLDRDDSPWYPTVRLFRQPSANDWDTVFTRVTSALQTFVDTASPESSQPLASNSLTSDSLTSDALADDANASPQPLRPPTPSTRPVPRSIGIGIELSTSTGWGTFGTNLTLHLLNAPDWNPVLLLPPLAGSQFNPLHQSLLTPLLQAQQQFEKTIAHQTAQHAAQSSSLRLRLPYLLLKALGNHFITTPQLESLHGTPTVGLIFFEDTALTTQDIERAHDYDLIITGSSWNAEVLQSYGIHHVDTVCQGIDPTLFHPAPRSGLFGDRFVIFSGGKLEYRKGQDLVIEAFRRFHQRHSDALLLTAWHNIWPKTIRSLEQSLHVTGLPTLDRNRTLHLVSWLEHNGIPPEAVRDLGAIANPLMGQLMREADVALFPNRCEGGTNLVAMECLACGVPTVLSANTGHLDLLNDGLGYALNIQRPVHDSPQNPSHQGWGESDIDEILTQLEDLYAHRAEATAKALNDAAIMLNEWSWAEQVKKLIRILGDRLS
jgi:tetratricopeptide (TPR) repeat protein/glycosyltransferase involved in cell wall biosynthesis